MSIDWTEILFKIAIFVISLLFYRVLAPAVTAWMNKNLSDRTTQIVTDAVKAAQQTLEGNEYKKLWVCEQVTQALEKLNIDITAEELDKMIEATVYSIKENK